MRIIRVALTNFRNYEHVVADLSPGRNILIGENAQGKTNFLEAIEMAAHGKAERAQTDADLIRKPGADHMQIEVTFEARGTIETISIGMRLAAEGKRIEKQLKINGLTQSMLKGVRGRLVGVSFKSQDLYLLRGGPKYRRDWIDSVLETLRPNFRDASSKYQKIVTQRNRLLKSLWERGRVTVTDQDQLKVWDAQLAKFGAHIIKMRVDLLEELLPKAERYQEHISGSREKLTAQYVFSSKSEAEVDEAEDAQQLTLPVDVARRADENAIAESILRILRERRAEEIARKQTLAGPHRDDISFCLNGASAVDFGSQGQQRSLVLSLKMAELERISEVLCEPPVLLLDDVLAELDLNRQGMLMSLVNERMQTVITTTHVDGFKPEWLDGALFLKVRNATIERDPEPVGSLHHEQAEPSSAEYLPAG